MIPARVKSWLWNHGRRAGADTHTRIVNGVRAAGNLLFPPACTYCGAEVDLTVEGPRPKMLCSTCYLRLVAHLNRPVCRHCASPLPRFWPAEDRCPRCQGRRYYFTQAMALGEYRAAMRQAVLWMKKPAFEPLTRSMGLLLADLVKERLANDPADVIVPVPMHWSRRLTRGTNTSQMLGAAVSSSLGWPVLTRLVRCRRKTRKQGTLRPSERSTNVRGAFRISAGYDITDTNVLLIDDIMTTGATASEAARVLRAAGARSVTVAVVARGVGDR